MKRINQAVGFFLLMCLLIVRNGQDHALCAEGDAFHPEKILTEDRRINDDTGTADQFTPALAMHKCGPSVVAWPDGRNGGSDIYFQLFNRRGQAFGTLGNVKVNDAGHAGLYMSCDAAMDGYGNFMVAWAGGSGGTSHIYGQWYLANGKPLGGNIQIDETSGAMLNGGEAAAGLDSGGVVVVWTDCRTDAQGDLMMQRFGRAGARQGSNTPVDTESGQAQKFAAAGADTRGNFTVVWQEGTTGSKIMGRRFDPEGRPLGSSFQVAPQSDPAALSCITPAIAVTPNGAFAVFWMADYGGGEIRRQACMYDSDGNSITGVFRVDEADKFDYAGEVSAASFGNSNFMFVWSGNHEGDWNIYYRVCGASGVMSPVSATVNDLPGRQMAPDVSADRANTVLFVWYDNRNGNFDVYGKQIGPDMPYSLTAGAGYDGLVPLSWEPSFGKTAQERYLIYRSENFSEEPVLLAAMDAASRPMPDRMLDFVDSTAENGRRYYYRVKIDRDNTTSNIASPVSPGSGGHGIASAWSLADPAIDGTVSPGEWDDAMVLDISEPDGFGNVHLYLKNTNHMLYLAVIDSNDAALEPATALGMLINPNHNGHWPKTGPSNEGLIALGPAGAVFWGYWGSYPDHLGGDALKTASSVVHAISGGSKGVAYEVSIDLAANPFPVSGGMSIGFTLYVSDPGNFYGYHYGYSGEWPHGSLWEAAETLGELKLAAGPDAVADSPRDIPASFRLGCNFPNPFNPSSTIPFTVKQPCRVTLKVRDVRGRTVATLADGPYDAGNHSIRFDASGLPSGLYLYTIEMGGFTAARKMAVMK